MFKGCLMDYPLDPNNSKHGPLPRAFVDVLAMLIRNPSVVGAEHSFFRVLQRELEERGAFVTWYEGVLVAQGHKPDSLYLSAHCDRHGLICTGPDEFQYAAFIAGMRSDLLGNSVDESMLRKIIDRFHKTDVFAYEPWSGTYLGKGSISQSYICELRHNLIFELEGLAHLQAGVPVAFTDKLVIADESIKGQLDNVLSVAALVYLFEQGFQGTAFFTAEEESGKSWRYLLEWFRRFGKDTNQLLVVDTSPFFDFEKAKEQDLVLRNKDANASFNTNMSKAIDKICNSHNISTLYKDSYLEGINLARIEQGDMPLSLGSTELGRIIHASNGLVDGTTLQVPTSGYHTMEESAPLASVNAFLRVLLLLAESYGARS